MAYKEVSMLVDKSMYKYKCPYAMTPIGICVHNTANDASARNEVSYMRRNKSKVSFHDAVDDVEVVHGVPHNRNAWHAGDGGSGTGNRHYIGIEICYSKSGGEKFKQAEINAAKYIAKLLKQRGWGIERVKRHYDFSKKYCPHRTMDMGWQRFLNMIKAELNGSDSSNNAGTVSNKIVVDGYWGKATTGKSQKVFGTTVDYIISKQPKSNKVYLPNCQKSSWKFVTYYKGGSLLVKAIQRHVGATVDGYFGPGTAKAVQKFLATKGLYKGAIDGIFGPGSVKAWQKYLNTFK